MAERQRFLRPHEVGRIRDNYMRGVEKLQLYLLLKTAVWDSLPLSLAGLAHHDADLATQHARTLMSDFDNQPANIADTCNHSLTLRLLHPDRGLRQHLELWANGTVLEADLPFELRLIFAQLYLWPVVERWLEQPHSQMKRLGSYRNVGGSFCSLTVRFPGQMALIAESGDYLRELVDSFDKNRSALGIIQNLRLTEHPILKPTLRELQAKDLPKSLRKKIDQRLRMELSHVVYLTCGRLQYRHAGTATKVHKRLRDEENKQAARLNPAERPERGYEAMRRLCFQKHLQDCKVEWFSLPDCFLLESGLLASMQDRLMHGDSLSISSSGSKADNELGTDARIGQPSLQAFTPMGGGDDKSDCVCITDPSLQQSLFRVVDWKPSRVKMLRKRGGLAKPVDKRCIAITLHDAAHFEGGLIVDSDARKADPRSISPVMALQDIHRNLGDDAFEKYFLGWRQSECERAIFGMCGYLQDIDTTLAITALVHANAWYASSPFEPEAGSGHDVALHALSDAGLLDEEGPLVGKRYWLTPLGARCIVPAVTLQEPTRMIAVREDLAIADADQYELVELLKRAEFTWKKMPAATSKARTRGLLCDLRMPDTQEKLWFGTPRKHYMAALLNPSAVMDVAQIQYMPHDRPDAYYGKLWKGIKMKKVRPLDPALPVASAEAAAPVEDRAAPATPQAASPSADMDGDDVAGDAGSGDCEDADSDAIAAGTAGTGDFEDEDFMAELEAHPFFFLQQPLSSEFIFK